MNVDQMERTRAAVSGRIGRAWGAMIRGLRDHNTVEHIAARLHLEDPVEGLQSAALKYAADVHAAYTFAGGQEARWLAQALTPPSRVRKKHIPFDATEPPAVAWANANKLDAVREITSEQRDTIRAVLTQGARTGANPREVARQIRESIGLTRAQLDQVGSFRRALESGQLSAALQRELRDGRFDSGLKAALRDGRAIPQERIDKMADAYRRNFINLRAENIARTEGLRVAHQGQDELFRQAIARGDVEASQLEGTWHHSPGAKKKSNERIYHKSMDGQTRPFGEYFESGIGGKLRYPGDPEADGEETICCRCVRAIRVLPSSSSSSARGARRPGVADEAEDVSDLADEAALAEDEEAAEAAEAAELDAEDAGDDAVDFEENGPGVADPEDAEVELPDDWRRAWAAGSRRR